MKFFLLIYLSLIFVQDEVPSVISKYDSTARIIWIFASSINSEKYNESLRLLSKDPLGLDKRNILIVEVFTQGGIDPDGKPISTDHIKLIRKYFSLENAEFKLILTDKGYKEIFREDKPISCIEIFNHLDSEDQ